MSVLTDILTWLGLLAQVAPMRASQTTPYAGMDIGNFPGLDFMTYLRGATNLTWTGAYLDSPAPFAGQAPVPAAHAGQIQGHNMLGGTAGHPAGSWMAGAATARTAGFGVLPIYWGQQDNGNNQGPWDTRAVAGVQNGADAIAKAGVMALAAHSVIYLDWEGALGPDGITYCTAWFAAVAEAGFRPGLYSHGAAAVLMRNQWPGLFVWVTNPWVNAVQTFVVPRVGAQVQIRTRDPGPSGAGQDLDGIAWQMWFSSSFAWPAALTFPAPALPATFPMLQGDGSPGFNAAGKPQFDLDVSSSSVADPAFPERANAPGLARRGPFTAAVVDATTLGMFGVRRGALTAVTWVEATPTVGTPVALPDHVLAYNPWSRASALQRGTSGDVAVVARSANVGTADNAWQLHAYRRRAASWTFDVNINGATVIEPLLGVQLVSRAPNTVEAFFVTNDGTNRVFVVSCVDAAAQADGQPWSAPVEVPAPAGGLLPSLVGGIGAASATVGTVDVFVVARTSAVSPWQLFWNASGVLGTWPHFSVPGDTTLTLHPFSNVAAVSRGPALLDVFAIAKRPADATWKLYTWWWNSATAWGASPNFNTLSIGAAITPHPVSKVAAVSRSAQYIDVFVVGATDGLLYNAYFDAVANTWSDFRRVGTNAIKVASVDGAFSRAATAVDVVVTGRDGKVYVSSWNTALAGYSDLSAVASFNLA